MRNKGGKLTKGRKIWLSRVSDTKHLKKTGFKGGRHILRKVILKHREEKSTTKRLLIDNISNSGP